MQRAKVRFEGKQSKIRVRKDNDAESKGKVWRKTVQDKSEKKMIKEARERLKGKGFKIWVEGLIFKEERERLKGKGSKISEKNNSQWIKE